MVTIAIADDHRIVLDGLELLLRRQADFKIVARCENAEETVRAVTQTRPDILLLDVRMPGQDGLWVLEQIYGKYPTEVILLTAGMKDEEITQALRLGVRGVVLKQRTGEDLVRCIREVQAGRQWIDQEVLQRAVAMMNNREGRADLLTPREFEVVRLATKGLRNKEIAAHLSVSEWTVKTHLRSVFRKLPVTGRVELAIWVQHHLHDQLDGSPSS